jgi:hypothetical protein
VTLRAGNRIRFDLPTDWKNPASPFPSEWRLDALRDPDLNTQFRAALLCFYYGPKAVSRDVVEQLVHLTASPSFVRGVAENALEYGKLPAPLNIRLIGFHPALGWFMVTFLTPFALLHLLIFLLDRQNRTALCYSIFTAFAALVAWYYMKGNSTTFRDAGVLLWLVVSLQVSGLGFLYTLLLPANPQAILVVLCLAVASGPGGTADPRLLREAWRAHSRCTAVAFAAGPECFDRHAAGKPCAWLCGHCGNDRKERESSVLASRSSCWLWRERS